MNFGTIKMQKALPYVMIGPACLLIAVFKLYPIGRTLVEGFVSDGKVGFDTYRRLFLDQTFWSSLWVTIKMNIVITPLQIFISLCLAFLVNCNLKGIGIFRTIYYLPVTISITVATLLWNMMFNVNNGILNSILNTVGISNQGFFIDKAQALWCIVVIANWKGVGYWMMFLLAGLKGIDATIYESAIIDGAGWLKRVTAITLPLIKNTLLFVFVADTTSNMLLFAPMQIITRGGPQGSTDVLMYEAYKSAFQFVDRSRSSAIVTVLLLMIGAVCVFQFKLLNNKEEN
ncbi:sugar ABC transporter permease [uncultured Sphaerochaeta sp.]|uniref:carbohydrate ABC transporter permease n=1 Tax=uncultured Sphaerochaeta sp. TaxID=886478 RepID=UPI002A0A99B1|nr:sugar ABC transporter permease [uncultured Sphaerochaeta sp.]